jgi:raffinose/stachyose/melibiose transport system substrate-binding protein
MNLNSKTIRLPVTLLALAVLVAACSGGAAAPTAAPAQPTAAPAAEPVSIRVINQFGVGVEPQPLLDEVAAEFNQEHPEIKVEFDWSGGGNFMDKYRAALQTGEPYDIVWQNEATAATLAREGVGLNLTQYLDEKNYEGDKTWKDTFIPSILARAWVEDGADGPGYYSIPDEQFIGGIFYNKAIFQQYNIAVPATWDDFMAVCKTLKDNGVQPISADGTVPDYNAFWFQYIGMREIGADVIYNVALNKGGTFDTPEFLDVAKKVASLRENGCLAQGYEGSAWPAAQMQFVQGQTGMILMKSWLPGEMLANTPDDFQYGFFAFPTIPGNSVDQTTVMLKFNGYVVTKDATHHDEAVLFLKKLLSHDVEERYTARSLYPGVLPGLTFPDSLKETLPVLENAKTVVGFGDGLDRDAYEWETRVLFPLCDKLFFGQITPEEFITQLQQEHEAYYAQQ